MNKVRYLFARMNIYIFKCLSSILIKECSKLGNKTVAKSDRLRPEYNLFERHFHITYILNYKLYNVLNNDGYMKFGFSVSAEEYIADNDSRYLN